MLAPVRQSLADGKPIVWNRINDLPEYVYFNHSIHIAKGVGCSSCHGPVDRMPLSYKAMTLTMAFCLGCHRAPGPRLRPKDQIYNTEWQRNERTPSPEALMAEYRIGGRNLADCSICYRLTANGAVLPSLRMIPNSSRTRPRNFLAFPKRFALR